MPNTALAVPEHLTNGVRMLFALGATGKHVYGGTVPAATVARRRAKERVARKSRRANR